ncbi:MAG TPA: ribonuclease HI family protein [Actinomycetota bacterium]|nr:ribonuclease HI family protein [Actinomycetota bacterium]
MTVRAILNTDGGARGNPGPAGIGVVLVGEDGEVIAELARGLGVQTNNVAEYEAVIAGLELARESGVDDLLVRVDSELVVRQLNGDWKIKNDRLRRLAVRARSLMRGFSTVAIEHVPRGQNSRADALANEAMDAAEERAPGEPGLLF